MNEQSQTSSPQSIAVFFLLAFLITWIIIIPTFRWIPEDYQLPFIILAAFGPFIASSIVVAWTSGKPALLSWLKQMFRVRGRWSIIATGFLVIPLLMGGMHFVLYLSLGGRADFSDANPWWTFPIAMVLTALLTGGNEEPGWRGFAAPALSAYFHPLLAAAILGVLHSLWHLPIIHQYDTTLGMYTFNVVGLTVILNWFYFKSKACIIPVMLLHAGTNVIGNYWPSPDTVLDGDGSFMLLRGIVYWVMAIAIILSTKGDLGYSSSQK